MFFEFRFALIPTFYVGMSSKRFALILLCSINYNQLKQFGCQLSHSKIF